MRPAQDTEPSGTELTRLPKAPTKCVVLTAGCRALLWGFVLTAWVWWGPMLILLPLIGIGSFALDRADPIGIIEFQCNQYDAPYVPPMQQWMVQTLLWTSVAIRTLVLATTGY